ncbi:MAG: TolC family protein [Planctomycetes bacterium]|nr:TolC family protein [Planctomycetota bacterium]
MAALLVACAPARFQPREVHVTPSTPLGGERLDASSPTPVADAPGMQPPAAAPEPAQARGYDGDLRLDAVLSSVIDRYPPFLAKLLERDLASGRLQQAMGGFDAYLSAKVGGTVQGFYESTVAQGLLEQPLATGDTIYGGYRVSDGFLPDYYGDRTQDDGEFVFGGRIPLLQNRSIDGRRADVRLAEIGVLLAEPEIRAARIEFVQKATASYHKWLANGRKLAIARELLQLANDRNDGLKRAVERQFLAPIALTDNERLIAQRRIYVAQAERAFQAAALELSLFLRDDDDRPIVAAEDNLPDDAPTDEPVEPDGSLLQDLRTAAAQRPELEAVQLRIEQAGTERDLADNQTLPQLDLIVEAAASLSDGPYKDREDLELFVGGELKVPIQRRTARGRLQQAEARWNRLRIEQSFLLDRIGNQILDARSAMRAASQQFALTRQNVDYAEQLVRAEQRAFDLGRSTLLNVQLREATLASARAQQIDARLRFELARAAYRAALGYAAE